MTEAQEHRTFDQNRRAAFLRLTRHGKFRVWLAEMTHVALGRPTIDQQVDEMMQDANLRIEVRDEHGRWVVETPSGR